MPLILCILLCSCTTGKRPIQTDSYPVSDSMLKYTELRSGDLISVDNAWFTNDTLGQTLVINLYTDYHRLSICHFYNNRVPDEILDDLEVSEADGDMAGISAVKEALPGFITQSEPVSKQFFVSGKGFQLGDHKQRVLAAYGTPDTSYIHKGLETCIWRYAGDKEAADNSGKALAANSYGYTVKTYYRNDSLEGMVLRNDFH